MTPNETPNLLPLAIELEADLMCAALTYAQDRTRAHKRRLLEVAVEFGVECQRIQTLNEAELTREALQR